jgi:hypothetical protein
MTTYVEASAFLNVHTFDRRRADATRTLYRTALRA